LTVPKLATNEPVQVVPCHWLPCSPDTIKQGSWNGFSAVGYFFGRELHQELNVPIGLIHSSWGGTIAEAWTSREAHAASLEDERAQAMIQRALPLLAGPPEAAELRPAGGKGL